MANCKHQINGICKNCMDKQMKKDNQSPKENKNTLSPSNGDCYKTGGTGSPEDTNNKIIPLSKKIIKKTEHMEEINLDYDIVEVPELATALQGVEKDLDEKGNYLGTIWLKDVREILKKRMGDFKK